MPSFRCVTARKISFQFSAISGHFSVIDGDFFIVEALKENRQRRTELTTSKVHLKFFLLVLATIVLAIATVFQLRFSFLKTVIFIRLSGNEQISNAKTTVWF